MISWDSFRNLTYVTSYLHAFKEFRMEIRLSNMFKTTNVTRLIKAILESSYRILKVTSIRKALKRPVHFLRAFEFWAMFNIQIDISLAIFWE